MLRKPPTSGEDISPARTEFRADTYRHASLHASRATFSPQRTKCPGHLRIETGCTHLCACQLTIMSAGLL